MEKVLLLGQMGQLIPVISKKGLEMAKAFIQTEKLGINTKDNGKMDLEMVKELLLIWILTNHQHPIIKVHGLKDLKKDRGNTHTNHRMCIKVSG